MGRYKPQRLGSRAKIVGDPELGTPLYEALYPRGRGKDQWEREEPAVPDKNIEVVDNPPRVHIPGGP